MHQRADPLTRAASHRSDARERGRSSYPASGEKDKEHSLEESSESVSVKDIYQTKMAHLKVLFPGEANLSDLLGPLPTEEGK